MSEFLKKYGFILVILIVLVSSISISFSIIDSDIQYSNIEEDDLDGINNLMIVAHPDDDILWGGGHLIEDDYLVVCVTCGVNKLRVKEFINVMGEVNDKYIMLGYPDKTNGERDNWDTVREDIIKDLSNIINKKDWDIIVTHNPEGEYGHQHHIMTSNITTDLVNDKDKLFYFGKYYSKKKLEDHLDEMEAMNDDLLKTKQEIIKLYESQSFIQTKFDHMNKFENWLSYKDWNDTYEKAE